MLLGSQVCLLQGCKHVGVINNDTTVLSREDTVCTGNRLHQGVILHWLVEIATSDFVTDTYERIEDPVLKKLILDMILKYHAHLI